MIDTGDFTQNFFPAEIDVEMAPIPEDELPALIDEALALPAIDFTLPAELLESTNVLLLAPIPRNEWRATIARLQQTATDTRTRRLLPAASNRLAARKPLELLQRLRLPRPLPLPVDTSDPREREWARLAALPNLWFVRRRNLAYREDLPGVPIPFSGLDRVNEEDLVRRLDENGLRPQFDSLIDRATTRGAGEVVGLLASPRFASSPALTAAALGELSRAERLDRASVLAVGARLSASGVGEGLMRLERTESDVLRRPEALARIAESGDWRKTDEAARAADASKTPALAASLAGIERARPVVSPPRVRPSGGKSKPKKAKPK
jgi:hypothetical protein